VDFAKHHELSSPRYQLIFVSTGFRMAVPAQAGQPRIVNAIGMRWEAATRLNCLRAMGYG
jgi:hypothetical protein